MRKKLPLVVVFVFLSLIAAACSDGEVYEPTPLPPEPTTELSEEPTPLPEPTDEPTAVSIEPSPFVIATSAFESGADIPEVHTCIGDNVSPELVWSGVPERTESLVLILYDPDAGFDSGASVEMGFVHWVVYGISPAKTTFPQDIPAGAELGDGVRQGSNDFSQFVSPGETFPGGAPIKAIGYDGPCPGSKHRYVFALYALDTALDLPEAPMAQAILDAMEGHVLDETTVEGFYTPPEN